GAEKSDYAAEHESPMMSCQYAKFHYETNYIVQ
ncbi:MAG: hypothetical protein RLY95_444, partial [Pseudomonadota bacterium]